MLLTAFSNLVPSPRTPKVPGFALPTRALRPLRPRGAEGGCLSRPARLLAKADVKKGEEDAKVCET